MVIIQEIMNHALLRDFLFVRGVIFKNEQKTTKLNKSNWNFFPLESYLGLCLLFVRRFLVLGTFLHYECRKFEVCLVLLGKKK